MNHSDFVKELFATLHVGESAAVALALQVPGSVLLIDEVAGRKTATRLGLRVVSTVGIRIQAKEQQLVERIEPCLHALR